MLKLIFILLLFFVQLQPLSACEGDDNFPIEVEIDEMKDNRLSVDLRAYITYKEYYLSSIFFVKDNGKVQLNMHYFERDGSATCAFSATREFVKGTSIHFYYVKKGTDCLSTEIINLDNYLDKNIKPNPAFNKWRGDKTPPGMLRVGSVVI